MCLKNTGLKKKNPGKVSEDLILKISFYIKIVFHIIQNSFLIYLENLRFLSISLWEIIYLLIDLFSKLIV